MEQLVDMVLKIMVSLVRVLHILPEQTVATTQANKVQLVVNNR